MKKIRTHYDNLKVAHNAPQEVIRAAYRSLSQKYHPDKNPNNPEAQRISAIINAAYDVLSDPAKRKEHDRWIAQQEITFQYNEPKVTVEYVKSNPKPKPKPAKKNIFVKPINWIGTIILHLVKYFVVYAIAAIVILLTWHSLSQDSPPKRNAPVKNATINTPRYVRPESAPNGQAWPFYSSYLKGYPFSNSSGLSKVTIDNSRNDSDVHVKLYSLNATNPYAVRQVFINGKGRFTMNSVSPGKYDVRYRDLDSGRLSRTESFKLQEIEKHDGTEYSDLRLTLYKIQNGNMETYGLSEEDF